jgi:segregation and condensation protein A
MPATLARPAPSLDAYQLRLPVYEGPLDVLLRLIEREQLPIDDVSLLAVLDQFLAFVRDLEPAPPDVIAEFAVIAGRLSLLKSRALLPRPARPADDADLPGLVRQLEEYRAVKSAAAMLAARQQTGAGVFGRGGGIPQPEAEPRPLPPQPTSALARAMQRWLSRAPAPVLPLVTAPVVTLRQMMTRILAGLSRDRHLPFGRIRAACASRQEVAVAFLALLTLLRRQQVTATQPELFGPITIAPTERAAIVGNGAGALPADDSEDTDG